MKVTFVGYQFLTDFDSQNRCVCSMRSHGPLLCAFCLCFHFKRRSVSLRISAGLYSRILRTSSSVVYDGRRSSGDEEEKEDEARQDEEDGERWCDREDGRRGGGRPGVDVCPSTPAAVSVRWLERDRTRVSVTLVAARGRRAMSRRRPGLGNLLSLQLFIEISS